MAIIQHLSWGDDTVPLCIGEEDVYEIPNRQGTSIPPSRILFLILPYQTLDTCILELIIYRSSGINHIRLS